MLRLRQKEDRGLCGEQRTCRVEIVDAADRPAEIEGECVRRPRQTRHHAVGGDGVGQIARGFDVAASHVTETDAAFIWPGRLAWADAETVTTLIEAHGARRESILRPRYGEDDGWPTLVPMTLLPLLRQQSSNLIPDEILAATVAAGARIESIDLGDPGVTHDIATPFEALPVYQGPAAPGAGMPPEWGAAAAEMPDDAPLEGPALDPYGQAADEGN